MGDLGAADLILARQAGDIRTGAANPTAFDHGGSSPRLRHVPGDELAAESAAKDQGFKPFRFRQIFPRQIFPRHAFLRRAVSRDPIFPRNERRGIGVPKGFSSRTLAARSWISGAA
jgi:hypothetical protein